MMRPLRRMALTLFVFSLFVLAAALYAARPRCECEYLGNGDADPADCQIHGEITE